MRTLLALALVWVLMPLNAVAQFIGPTTTGRTSTVEQARNADIDTYVTVTGNIVAHLRRNYYTFRDNTGDIRLEIEPRVWRDREVGPDTTVRLLAEVDRNEAGTIYLWVESLEIID